MHNLCKAISALFLASLSAVSADEKAAAKQPQNTYPANVAMSEEPPKGMVFRHFPSGMRLYVYDKDSPGTSVCNLGCESAWPPLIALPESKPMGEWTQIKRHDGKQQWAYQGRPVYLRFHDDPNSPSGDGLEGVWHMLPHFKP